MPCLTAEQIEKLARSELEPDKTAELRAHIEQCDTCRAKLDECLANEQHLLELKQDGVSDLLAQIHKTEPDQTATASGGRDRIPEVEKRTLSQESPRGGHASPPQVPGN